MSRIHWWICLASDRRREYARTALSGARAKGSGITVFLVDDDSGTREALAYFLQSGGYKVRAFDNAPDALAALNRGERPRVVILDLIMPRMDGFEFRRRQLLDPGPASVPVIVLSGTDDTDETRQRLGAVHYLRKPVDLDLLRDIVAAYPPGRP